MLSCTLLCSGLLRAAVPSGVFATWVSGSRLLAERLEVLGENPPSPAGLQGTGV